MCDRNYKDLLGWGPAVPAAAPAAPAAAVSMHAPSGQHQALLWPLATLECPPQGLCPRCWLSQLITSNAGAPGGEHPGLHRGNCAQGWGYPGDPRVLPHLPPPRGGFRVGHIAAPQKYISRRFAVSGGSAQARRFGGHPHSKPASKEIATSASKW